MNRDQLTSIVIAAVELRSAIAEILSVFCLAGCVDHQLILSVMLSCEAVSRAKQQPHTTDTSAAAARRTSR